MKLSVWSPWPPAASGVADYAAEQLAALREHARVTAVAEAPEAVRGLPDGVAVAAADAPPAADLDLYHLGNSALHGFVYRRARAVPGVVLIHDACLHHLVLGETVERGDAASYLRLMRREHGERGTFVARRARAGWAIYLWPALHPLSEHLLEASASSPLSRGARTPGTPVLALPMHRTTPRPRRRRRGGGRWGTRGPRAARLARTRQPAQAPRRCSGPWPLSLRFQNRCSSSWPATSRAGLRPRDRGARRQAPRQRRPARHGPHRSDFAAHLAAADVVLALA